MKRVFGYLAKFKKEAILAPLFKMLEATFELLVPLVVKSLVDVGIRNADKPYILAMCGLLVLFCIIGFVSAATAQYFSAKAAVGVATELRHDMFLKVQRFCHAELDTVGISNTLTRMTSDLTQVQTGINITLRLLLRSPFIVFGAMILAFTIDVRCALIFAVAIPLLLVVVFAITLVTVPMFRRVQSKLGDVLKSTRGSLVGARVIRAFCAEDRMTREFDNENDLLTSMQKKAARISVLLNPLTYLIINAAVIVLIWTGAVRMEAGLLTQGALLALYDYMSQILIELIKFANFIVTVTKSVASAERIDEFMASGDPRAVLDAPRDADKPYISFDHVSFHYPRGGDVLHDISFTANRGETVGIIGGTGSGKTTLVSLIPRLYDADSGEVLVDGVDVRDYSLRELREGIGMVLQKNLLFSGTVAENLRWGDEDASDEEMRRAASYAQADGFVSSFADGYDHGIERGGANVSGGQKQRLCIARALLKKPKILIFDDSTSAVDTATEAKIREAFRTDLCGSTKIIIAQRVTSVMDADRILVLEDGSIAGLGTHDELMQSCEEYKEIYSLQMENKEAKQNG